MLLEAPILRLAVTLMLKGVAVDEVEREDLVMPEVAFHFGAYWIICFVSLPASFWS